MKELFFQNGLRRRTPGGVYFFLLKRDDQVTNPMLKEIFAEQVKLDNKKRKEDLAKHRDKEVEQLKQSLNGITLLNLLIYIFYWLLNTELKQSAIFSYKLSVHV